MTLDEKILADATVVRDRLLELRHEEERAQADLHHAIRRLHAAGGSLREIADELGLSHQRVHQIVGAAAPFDRPRRHRGGLRARFTRAAAAVVAAGEREARALGHVRVGTEHLLLGALAIEAGGAHRVLTQAGLDAEKLRAAVAELGESGESKRRRLSFTRAARRALEHALDEAVSLQSRVIGSEHVLLGLLAAEGSGARDVLERLGADPAALRDATIALLSG